MGNLTEHVMINKWDDDINEAIVSVGGNTYNTSGLPDYAGVIKTQLISNEAVGNGVYQDFLYVDEKNQTSNNPWEGEPTTSTNAIQSTSVAKSIKELFDIMALTERFNVLLVDEFPKDEVNLSAIYLVKSHCECGETKKENTYNGCYYIKTGKVLKRVDIPEFTIQLESLFYLTREEYNNGMDNIQVIESSIRKKFGKYWEDENFSLELELDNIKKDTEQKFIEQEEKFDQKYMNVENALTDEELNDILK